jgi:hypothetical protein
MNSMYSLHFMRKLVIITFISILFFSACKTDFNSNAPWQDITVVYGLLNQKDSANIHYIKINKAFLGEGNALTMAQIADSCTYGNNLEVRIEEWRNGGQTNLWYLDTTTIYNKEAGTFYYPKQVVYYFKAQLDTLDQNTDYRLYIKNKKSGKLISSHTGLVHDFSVEKPMPNQAVNFTSTSSVKVIWDPSYYGKLYQLTIQFTYREKNIHTQDSVVKTLDWNLGSYASVGTTGNETPLEASFMGASFYSFLRDNIPANSNVIRTATGYPLQYIFSAAADDFNTYINVNAPSTSVVEDRPGFTNITNGIGIFSSRYQIKQNHFLNGLSMDSLFNGSYTKNLHFQ